MKKGNISVFVPHVGCPNKCSFCNQNTITGICSVPTAQDVVDAVETALKKDNYEYQIAFFGGSFTAIERNYMLSLLNAAKPYVESGAVKGIRCSTRPDFIDDEILLLLKEYGVTTVELGAQSMDDGVLKKNMRGHTADDVRIASNLIKKYNISLGLQMMTDLYGSSPELDIYTAQELIKLNPQEVRIYPTVVLRDTYLERLFSEGKYSCSSIGETVALCARLVNMFEEKSIRVIRVGLHASNDIKRNMICGGYHDCLGELVKSKIMMNKIMEYPKGNYDIYINQKSISKLKGLKKSNISALENAGYFLNIKIDNSLEADELRLV